jgi:uncharacterized repeat protein (TIGR03803 family)
MKLDFMKKNRGWGMQMVQLAVMALAGLAGFTPGAWGSGKLTNINTFGGTNGALPSAALIFDTQGNLYGTTISGGSSSDGVVFELTPAGNGTWTESVLYSFCSLSNCTDGEYPASSLIYDLSGNLYGTTYNGGAQGFGTVFELTPSGSGTWTESVLYSFCSLAECSDGASPADGLIFDQSGNLYSTTRYGGAKSECTGGCGTAFELTPNGGGTWTESVLYSFCSLPGCPDGKIPSAGLIFDTLGNLYGTTVDGGAYSAGSVFTLQPNQNGGWTESVLYNFCTLTNCDDGAGPGGGLTFDATGNLYGVTDELSNGQTAFKLTPNQGAWNESVLYRFCSLKKCSDGSEPVGAVILDSKGNVYGATETGGAGKGCGTEGCGVLYELTLKGKSWHETVLYSFTGQQGAYPRAGLVFDGTGNLYGTTQGFFYDQSFGTVFEFTP